MDDLIERAESDDLIIKGAKGIQDGLYNIKDGELFEYKAKGGTVRVYSIVPSAEAVQGEWYQIKDHKVMGEGYMWRCSICDYKVYQDSSADYPSENFCPNCGARMKGEVEE